MVYLLLALATYRATRFLISDTLIEEPRRWTHGRLTSGSPGPFRVKLFDLSTCPYCLSVWVAALLVAPTDHHVGLQAPLLGWLAVAGGAMVVYRYVES